MEMTVSYGYNKLNRIGIVCLYMISWWINSIDIMDNKLNRIGIAYSSNYHFRYYCKGYYSLQYKQHANWPQNKRKSFFF